MIDATTQRAKKRISDRRDYRRCGFRYTTQTFWDDLDRELEALGATDVVLEGFFEPRQLQRSGWPLLNSTPNWPDIRLFFTARNKLHPQTKKPLELKFECNTYGSWELNLRAITICLQRRRLEAEEHGIGTGSEAYVGFAALPPGGGLVAEEFASVDAALRFLSEMCVLPPGKPLDELYRACAKIAHPDRPGGSTELMAKVNRAKDFVEKHASK